MARILVFIGALFCLLGLSGAAMANEGTASGAADEPLRFVVNLADSSRMLRTDIVLDTPKPEMGGLLKNIRPRIQHQLILLLSAETPEHLLTLEGKKSLAARIRKVLNELLRESDKTGIREVLFTDFIIQ